MSTTRTVHDAPRRAPRRPTAPMGLTAALLLGLLREDERYRRTWRARMDRTPTADVQQSAVARVLADHLWETGQADEEDEALPRRLKDTVARALSGRHLSPRTLRLFIDAFEMGPAHRTLLWTYLEREVGVEEARARAAARPRRARGTPAGPEGSWECASLHELHTVSAEGLVHHRVVHVVRALEPVGAITLPLAPPGARLSLRHGAVVSPAHRRGDVQGAVEVHLLQELDPGGTAVLEYDVTPADGTVDTEARTLLPVMAAGSTAVVQIRFHPGRLPRQLWWWREPDDADGHEEEPDRVLLGPDHGAHRFLTEAAAGAVGFRWSW